MLETELNVLLIEGDRSHARAIEEMFAAAPPPPVRIKVADRLTTALERVGQDSIGAILLDLSLPDSHGLATLDAVHASAPHIPIIVLTGADDDQLALSAVRAGAQDYLVKGSVNHDVLKRAMRYAIERKRAERALRESEGRFGKAFLASPAPMGMGTVAEGRMINVNDRYAELFGYSREEMIGRTVAELKLWADLDDRDQIVEMLRKSGSVRNLETRFRCKSGEMGHGLLSMEVIESPLQGDSVLIAMLNDITGRKRLEDALKASEEKFRLITENVSDMIALLDIRGFRVYNNPAYRPVLGDPESLIGTDSFRELHPEDRERIRQVFLDTVKTGLGHEAQFRFVAVDGSVRYVESRGNVIRDNSGNVSNVVIVSRDVTERKRAEDELIETNDRLRFLSHRVLEIQEEERRNVARELHDGLGQDLTALKLHLHMTDPQRAEACKSKLAECVALVEHAIEQVRELSLRLRPGQLDDLGLVAALRWTFGELTRSAGLTLRFAAGKLVTPISPDIEIACYRVAQEALTNIVKHAGARRVWLSLSETAGELTLKVRDDGRGFDVEAARRHTVKGHSFGLLSMQERVTLAGGRMALHSVSGNGTEFVAVFPLTPAAAVNRRTALRTDRRADPGNPP